MVAINRRNPSRALTVMESCSPYGVLDQIEMLAGDFWSQWPSPETGHITPTDMYESGDQLVMKVELPGIKKEDVDVSLEGNQLWIKAERQTEDVGEDTNYYFCERHFGRFSRSVTLPFPVDASKISTSFDNGLLEIRLPKAEEAKAKHISIKGGSPKAITSRSK